MKRAVCLAVSMVLIGSAAPPAMAHQSPPTCTKNGLSLNIDRSQTLVKNGDQMSYRVTVSNNSPGSCDITGATIDLVLPAPDGTASGSRVRVVTGANFLAGYPETVIGTVPYTVALNKGVTSANVRVTLNATLHDIPQDTSLAGIFKELGTVMPPPSIVITKTASPTSGPAPLTVTYTYEVTNNSPLDLPVANVAVSDDLCPNATYASGDVNTNRALDITERWVFTCTTTHPNPGTFTDTAYACGDGVLGLEHVCSGNVQATVTVTPPPANPVLVSASHPSAKPATCISVPKTLAVRAKELTTVKVTVTNGTIAGASITLTGPGIKRSGKTNSKGVVSFKVRPTTKGTLTIKSTSCLNAERFSVKGARQTQSRQVPRVTG